MMKGSTCVGGTLPFLVLVCVTPVPSRSHMMKILNLQSLQVRVYIHFKLLLSLSLKPTQHRTQTGREIQLHISHRLMLTFAHIPVYAEADMHMQAHIPSRICL